MIGLRIIVLAFIATTISSNANAESQCPYGYFKIGPVSTNRSIGAGLPSQFVATGCIKVDTSNQELATLDAVVMADISHAQALVDLVVANLGAVTRKCTGLSSWRDFEIAISTAALESGIGAPHFTVTGTAKACLAPFPVSFTLNMPVRFVVTPQESITLAVDKPSTDLPAPINGIVSSLIYKRAQAYTRVFRISLSTVVPKEVFLLNPQVRDVTASYGNDALSARVTLTGQITSAVVTKAINDRLQASNNLHF